MKKILVLLFIGVLYSCTGESGNQKKDAGKIAKGDSAKKQSLSVASKKDTGTSHIKSKTELIVSKNSLLGIWTSKLGQNASFKIDKNTVYFPEQDQSYPYTVIGDSLIIKYDDGNEGFAYRFKSKDMLILNGIDGEKIVYRVNN